MYHLSVTISPQDARLHGTAVITSASPTRATFDVGHLTLSRVVVDGKPLAATRFKDKKELHLFMFEQVEFHFNARYNDSYDHGIFPDTLVLTDHWFPVVDALTSYRMQVDLPEGYHAITSSDSIQTSTDHGRTRYRFDFPHPQPGLEGLALLGGPNMTSRETTVDGVVLQVLVRKGMEDQADRILAETKSKFAQYHSLFGPYPYRRLAVVDTPVTTSLSYPGLLVMTRKNLRNLPQDATLAHELVHEWFGNTVFIDWKSGNWAEGAAIYFADHAAMEARGEGWRCRQRMMQGYRTWVLGEQEIPLTRFEGREDRMTRSVGYGKGALVYHMLRIELGDEAFFNGIRTFMQQHHGAVATWHHLQQSFEQASSRNLDWFFRQWVQGVGLPSLTATVEARGDRQLLRIAQQGAVMNCTLPIVVRTAQGDKRMAIRLEGPLTEVSLDGLAEVREVALDPDYDLLRVLASTEYGPSIERLDREQHLLIIPPRTRSAAYQPLIERLKNKKPLTQQLEMPSDIGRQGRREQSIHRKGTGTPLQGQRFWSGRRLNDQELAAHTLVIMGNDHPILRRLFSTPPTLLQRPPHGVSLTLLTHPLNPQRLVAVFDSSNAQETALSQDKLENYGGNAAVSFKGGELFEKRLGEAKRGMVYRMP